MVATDDVRRVAEQVCDPELPALTIADLGILRDVTVDASGRVVVDITPTYSGCPAIDMIRHDLEQRLREEGYLDVTVRTVLAPAWTSDWMSDEGRRKLRAYGVAPPRERGPDAQLLQLAVVCPHCDSPHTAEVSHFGSTPCQALRRCSGCSEPFQHFKEH